MQGGLEIPCKVTASLNGTYISLLIMEKSRQLVEDLHIQLAAEDIVASFWILSRRIIVFLPLLNQRRKNKTRNKKTASYALQRNIRTFFNEAPV